MQSTNIKVVDENLLFLGGISSALETKQIYMNYTRTCTRTHGLTHTQARGHKCMHTHTRTKRAHTRDGCIDIGLVTFLSASNVKCTENDEHHACL